MALDTAGVQAPDIDIPGQVDIPHLDHILPPRRPGQRFAAEFPLSVAHTA